MKSFVVVLFACMAGIFPAIFADLELPDRRYFRGYTGYNNTGYMSEFFDSVPDLGVYSMGDTIRSFCFTGQWNLYSQTDYLVTGNNYVGIDQCQNLDAENPLPVWSLRYAGSPYGLNDVYYNLYANPSYGGAEFQGNTDAASVDILNQSVNSIIISGQSSWTFFTGFNYTGPGLCVQPTSSVTGENGVVMDFNNAYVFLTGIDVVNGYIRSVARGCLSEVTVSCGSQEPPSV